MLSDCRPVLSVTLVYCGQTVGRIKMKLGFGLGHIVLDGDLAPTPPKGHSPQFSAHICCCKMAGWIKMPLGTEVGLGPGHIVLDGDPAPPPQKGGTAPQFSAHVYCGQTAGWIKMPLGMEVGLGPGHTVLDGDPDPQKRRHSPPIFSLCLLWPNDWIDPDATWCEGRPRPRPNCVTWGHSSPPKGPQLLADVYCGQTVAHLSYC